MGGTKPSQSVNTSYSVDITSSSCTNGKFPQWPHHKLTVLIFYAKLTGLQEDETLSLSPQRENH